MKTSATGVALIQAFESCLKPTGDGRYRTYRCPANVVTIGWGTTASDVPTLKEGDIWTKAQCDEIFAASLGKYESAVMRVAAARARPLNQNQFDALVSFVYNVGPGGFDGSVGRAVRDCRDDDVPEKLALWNKAGGKVLPGLVRRRKAEGQLWDGDIKAASVTAQAVLPASMPQRVDEGSETAPRSPVNTVPGHPASASVAGAAAVVAAGSGYGFSWPTIAALAIGAAVVGFVVWQIVRSK